MINFLDSLDSNDELKKVMLYAVADGELINMEEVNDLTFARRMMGNGYAIRPKNGTITSPVVGKVTHVFPTKHVVGFKAEELELLLHMGIDTVSLNGAPFDTQLEKGQLVTNASTISNVDLELLKEENKVDEMIVIFVNTRKVVEHFELYNLEDVEKGQEIGYVLLKK